MSDEEFEKWSELNRLTRENENLAYINNTLREDLKLYKAQNVRYKSECEIALFELEQYKKYAYQWLNEVLSKEANAAKKFSPIFSPMIWQYKEYKEDQVLQEAFNLLKERSSHLSSDLRKMILMEWEEMLLKFH